jgi:hypothetical protein
MASTPRLAAAAAFAVITLGHAAAHAEVTGWMHLGGGAMGWKGGDRKLGLAPTMAIDAGVGTGPLGPVRVGGIFRVMPVFGEGADLSLMARLCTNGFMEDWFGFAFDVGPYQRWWSPDSTGVVGQITLGMPIGFQLSALGSYGTNDSYGFGGVLGIDLARLTTHRKHLLDWWPNPRPSERFQQARR